MKYLLMVINKKRSFLVLIILLSIINSALFSLIPLLINAEINRQPFFFIDYHYNWLVFAASVLLSYFSKKYFQGHMIRFTNRILFDLELSILEKLRHADYENFSKLDKSNVYTVMADIKVVSQLPRFFIDMINNMVMILTSMLYLFFVSPPAAMGVLLCSLLLIMYYYTKNITVSSMLGAAREMENDYYRYLHDFLSDFKSFKLDYQKGNNLFNKFFSRNRKSARDLEIKASVVYMNNELLGSYGWFIILGVIIFLLPVVLDFEKGEMTSFIIIILYLMGPVTATIASMPFFTRIRIAIGRIEMFTQKTAGFGKSDVEPLEIADTKVGTLSIRMDEVGYMHADASSERKFSLGPVSLNITKGEITFITGENGSGKSTFLLLLSGLLKPQQGNIFINEELLTEEHYVDYRNRFSAIFTDSILPSENYQDIDFAASEEELLQLLKLMQLKENMFSQNGKVAPASLSKGQQKRVALIYAMMESKDILLLDEWAAEQDPVFRAFFYKTILSKMREAGKTVIAVTHDDKYFDYADRVIQFNMGKITVDSSLIGKGLSYA